MARWQSFLSVFPGGHTSLFRTKTSRSSEHKVTETGSKNFVSGSLEVIIIGVTPISTP